MISTVMLLWLASSPQLKLAAPGFTCEGLSPGVCSAYLERFSALLSDEQLKVVTASDVANLLGFERQRQLLGCTETNCLAELAGGLGVDGLLSGSLVKTSSGWLATLKIVRARDGSTWRQASERVKDEGELQTFLDETAKAFQRTLTGKVTPATPFVRWVPALVGGAAVIAGAVSFGISKSNANTLRDVANTPLSPERVTALVAEGRTTETLGLVLGGVGVAAIAASIAWVTLGPDVQATVSVLPEGASLTVRGTW